MVKAGADRICVDRRECSEEFGSKGSPALTRESVTLTLKAAGPGLMLSWVLSKRPLRVKAGALRIVDTGEATGCRAREQPSPRALFLQPTYWARRRH